jgi:hypothetical protein
MAMCLSFCCWPLHPLCFVKSIFNTEEDKKHKLILRASDLLKRVYGTETSVSEWAREGLRRRRCEKAEKSLMPACTCVARSLQWLYYRPRNYIKTSCDVSSAAVAAEVSLCVWAPGRNVRIVTAEHRWHREWFCKL